MTKEGEKDETTSLENCRKVLKFTESLIEGEVVEPETRDYSPSLLHHRMAPPDSIRRNLIREEIVTSLVTERGLQIRKTRTKLSNEMIGKGKSQPRSSPEIPRPGTEQLLTIIPRARMGSQSIAHEAEGQIGY